MRGSALVLAIVVVVTGALSAGDKDKAATTKAAAPKAATTKPATATAKPPVKQEAEFTGQDVLKAMGRRFRAAVEKVAGGEIDWTRNLVIASGTAKAAGADNQSVAMARRGARLLAARNAVLLVGGIRVGPGGQFPQIKEGKVSVDAVVKGLRELSWKFDRKAMTVTVTAGVPIYGADGIVRVSGLTPAKRAGEAAWLAVNVAGARANVVIIDGRGTGFLPCLAPQITASTGRVFLSAQELRAGEFQKRGMVVYIRSTRKSGGVVGIAKKIAAQAGRIDPAIVAAARKVYKSPLMLQADKSPTNSRGTLVLTNVATRTLIMSGKSRDLFRGGRVIVITDIPSAEK